MITYVIIGVTVVVSYICFGNHELFRKLAFIPYCTVHNREWYRLITHGFVHADMTHLLVNMFTFWSFGTYMESAFGYLGLGTGGYLGLYFGGMVAASLYDLIRRRNDPYYVSIGASGAVYAILLAFGMLFPNNQLFIFPLPFPIKAKFFVIGYALIELYAGFANNPGDNVAHFAHLGGMIFGFILIMYWRKKSRNNGTYYN
jgi:membrane associated rhomboid family serine protease